MKVGHFLVCRWAIRLPQAQALRGESLAHRPGHLDDSGHKGATRNFVYLEYVLDMTLRNDEYVAMVGLAQIHERDGLRVVED
jgi:hypothetical protein